MNERRFFVLGVITALLVVVVVAFKPKNVPKSISMDPSAGIPGRAAEILSAGLPGTSELGSREVELGEVDVPMNVEVVADGMVVSQGGGLWYRDPSGALKVLDVARGIARIDRSQVEFWQGLAQKAWFVPDRGFAAIVRHIGSEGQSLKCEIGRGQDLSILVTDREGAPIQGASVSLDTTFASDVGSVLTRADGRWSGRVYGEGRVGLTCSAVGYGEGSLDVDYDLEDVEPIERRLILDRIVAVGVIVDRRLEQSVSFKYASSLKSSVRDESFVAVMQAIEERAQLHSVFEGVEWRAVVQSGAVQHEPLDVEIEHFIDGELVFNSEVALQHVLDPEFKLLRLPVPRGQEALVPFDVVLTGYEGSPVSHGPPAIMLHWRSATSGSVDRNIMGRKVKGDTSRYRFFLPPGNYELDSAHLAELSPGKASASPRIVKESAIKVEGGVLPPSQAIARLQQDCYLVRYEVVDSAGVVYTNSWMIQDGSSRHGIGVTFLAPGQRAKTAFVSVGVEYEVFSSPIGTAALLPTGVVHTFSRASFQEGGVSQIILPREEVPILGETR